MAVAAVWEGPKVQKSAALGCKVQMGDFVHSLVEAQLPSSVALGKWED